MQKVFIIVSYKLQMYNSTELFHNFNFLLGMKKYCETYKNSIYDTSMTFGPVPKFEGEMAEKISNELNEICPLDKLPERRAWRDEALTKLSLLKKELEKKK